jgi:CRP/FNR family transcriptional regulator
MRTSTVSRLQSPPRRDIDCAECPAGRRCWDQVVSRGDGFTVRREVRREPGDLVFDQGDEFAAIYLVTGGCVKLCESREDGLDRVLGFRVAGEVLGLEGLVRGNHGYRAEAIEPTTVCRLQWSFVDGASPPPLVVQRLLLKAVNQFEGSLKPWGSLPATEQVASFLKDFATRSQRDESLPLPMTRAEIGSYLGLAEETVVRAMGRLRKARG